jgi:septum formation protein
VRRLVLASASPARLATLRAAGINPLVAPTDIDEPAVLAAALARDPSLPPAAQVTVLARAKAEAAAASAPADAFVLGCDSMLELDGEILGKPRDAADAARRIRQQSGRQAVLHTGHWLIGPVIDPVDDAVRSPKSPSAAAAGAGESAGRMAAGTASSTGARQQDLTDTTAWAEGARPAGAPDTAPAPPEADGPAAAGGATDLARTAARRRPSGQRRGEGAASSTQVRFGELTEAEIDAYVATGEPLAVAGAFTIDGLGGPFIEGVVGDHHGVVGLSLPTLRHLLARFGVTVFELWRADLGRNTPNGVSAA